MRRSCTGISAGFPGCDRSGSPRRRRFADTDLIVGGDQNDVGSGDAGNDVINGAGGQDALSGGDGDGGRGADVFVFDLTGHSAPGQRDVLRAGDGGAAFDGTGAAAGDRFDLSGIDANVSVAGNQSFVFGSLGRGGISVVTEGSNTVIHGNTDGDAAFELEIVIEDGGVLGSACRAGDFIL